MNLGTMIALAATGVLIGAVAGMLGIGGGLLVIPALTLLFHFGHREAVGTSVGMLLPPIGLFAFLAYYKAGMVDLRAAALLAAGFAAGGYIGGWAASTGRVPETILQRAFAVLLLYYAASLLIRSDRQVWAAAKTVGAILGAGVTFGALRLLGRRWAAIPPSADVYHAKLETGPPPEYEI